MLSKFMRPLRALGLLVQRAAPVARAARSDLIPPSQYDVPIPRRLHLGYAMRVYWEIIPVIVVTVFTLSLTTTAIFWALVNKVDCSYAIHNEKGTISRTMDLRNPSIHKMRIINQRYEPWPEMQEVLDKMTTAEKRALVRMQTCAHP